MRLSAIIMAIIAIGGAIIGGLFGHKIGRSSGVSDGVQKQVEVQQVEQAKATVRSVQERANVEKTVSADNDSALNDRLSKYDRPD